MQKNAQLLKFAMYPFLTFLFFITLPNTPVAVPSQKAILLNAPSFLRIPTYEGSGQVTHPDVLVFESPWNGDRYWMVATPFPERNESHENPSVFVSNDGEEWMVPNGLSNPIAFPPANAHLSDPDIMYAPSYGLRVYYRLVVKGYDRILLTQSRNGKDWTQPLETIAVPFHHLISPAVILLGSRYIMYSVKFLDFERGSVVERRTSKDGIRWSPPKTVSVADTKEKIWHIDAQYVPTRKEFWMLFYSYSSSHLYLAVSKDGVRFRTLPIPLLARSDDPKAWDSDLYRSTFHITKKGDFLLWYSGRKKDTFRIGFVKSDLSQVIRYIP